MSSSPPVALVFGAGANVGQSVGRAFAAKGYRIALVARCINEEDSTPDQLHIRGDFADPASIAAIFSRVESQLGLPSVVVYNAAAWTKHEVKVDGALAPAGDPLHVGLPTVEDFASDLAINTTSAFAAAQQALLAFKRLPASASRTFVYTGNCLPVRPIAGFMSLGAGKSAAAHVVQYVAEAYGGLGFKFYYADERNADGTPVFSAIDGPAHAQLYTELAEGASQGLWC